MQIIRFIFFLLYGNVPFNYRTRYLSRRRGNENYILVTKNLEWNKKGKNNGK